jgi:hypothetical protein
MDSGENLMDELDKLSSAEISDKIDEKEKELSTALKDYQITEQAKLNLQKEILEKQVKKKDLEISLSVKGHNIRQIGITLKLLRSKFWAVKGENR